MNKKRLGIFLGSIALLIVCSFAAYQYWLAPTRILIINATLAQAADIALNNDCARIEVNCIKKEDVKGEVKDGYLIITASTKQNKEEKNKDGKYIRKERYSGTCQRSFYVGEDITQEDIKAKFEDGVLKLEIPKKEAKPEVKEAKYISIA